MVGAITHLIWPTVQQAFRNAQIAAEANFELARVRAAFEAVVARMSISHTSNAGPDDTCNTGPGKSAAPIRTLAELDKLDRYERRAFSRRRRALRELWPARI